MAAARITAKTVTACVSSALSLYVIVCDMSPVRPAPREWLPERTRGLIDYSSLSTPWLLLVDSQDDEVTLRPVPLRHSLPRGAVALPRASHPRRCAVSCAPRSCSRRSAVLASRRSAPRLAPSSTTRAEPEAPGGPTSPAPRTSEATSPAPLPTVSSTSTSTRASRP